MKIIQSPSSNFSTSKYTKIGVQIHKTLGLMPSTLHWLQDKRAWSSAHYLITKLGEIHQLVALKDRSWSSGRINQPSGRARQIMLKNLLGRYVKPGHYLVQVEFECLENQTFTEDQYKAAEWLFKQLPFDVSKDNFLTHQDTAIDKPDLSTERIKILSRLQVDDNREEKKRKIIQLVNEL